jgi:hypothetical protein
MDSKASQDSKYSVEYTQNVAVKAGQAGLPDGLQTILNILSSSVTGSNPNGEMLFSPASGSLDYSSPGKDSRVNFELHLKDDEGMNLKNTEVTFALTDPSASGSVTDAFVLGQGLAATEVDWSSPAIKTDNTGKILFSLWLADDPSYITKDKTLFELTGSATIKEAQKISIPISITNITEPSGPSLSADPSPASVKKDATNLQITVTAHGKTVSGVQINSKVSDEIHPYVNAPTAAQKTGTNGTVQITYTITKNDWSKDTPGTITLSATIDSQNVKLTVPVTLLKGS